MVPKGAKTTAVEESIFDQLLEEWERVSPPVKAEKVSPVKAWEATLKALAHDAEAIRKSGGWNEKPESILSLIGRGRRETYHCRVLAWLLDPSKEHGLGDLFLRRFLSECGVKFKASVAEDFGQVHVRCEERRDASRTDIVIRGRGLVVAVEAKIDHAERHRQCEDMRNNYARDRARLVFLTVDGGLPKSTEELDSFCFMSWKSHIRSMLADSIRDCDGRVSSPTLDYAVTLDTEFPKMSELISERLAFYLKHKKQIEVWAQIRPYERRAMHAFFRRLESAMNNLAANLGDCENPVLPWPMLDCAYPAYRFYRRSWTEGDDDPLFCVALEYQKSKASFDDI